MSTLVKVIAWILLAPIVILVVGIGGCEATKAYYDWKVRLMCNEDGGIKVYERLPVSQEFFASMGGDRGAMSLPTESAARIEIPIFQRTSSLVIKDGYIKIGRHETQIVRRSDSKVLGSLVLYGRSGGDFPFTVSAPTHYQCPDSNNDVVRRVLIIKGESK